MITQNRLLIRPISMQNIIRHLFLIHINRFQNIFPPSVAGFFSPIEVLSASWEPLRSCLSLQVSPTFFNIFWTFGLFASPRFKIKIGTVVVELSPLTTFTPCTFSFPCLTVLSLFSISDFVFAKCGYFFQHNPTICRDNPQWEQYVKK